MLVTLKGERIKITDHLVCTSENSTYCITCIYRREIYISETGRLLGDRFREHLCMQYRKE